MLRKLHGGLGALKLDHSPLVVVSPTALLKMYVLVLCPPTTAMNSSGRAVLPNTEGVMNISAYEVA